MAAKKPSGEEFWDNPKDDRHGTVNGYNNLGCNCDGCTEAWRVSHLEYMSRDDNRQKHANRTYFNRTGSTKRKVPYKPRPHTWGRVTGGDG